MRDSSHGARELGRVSAECDRTLVGPFITMSYARIVFVTSGVVLLFAVARIVPALLSGEEWSPFGIDGHLLFEFALATCGASLWFLRAYPKWVRGNQHTGDRFSRNEIERDMHPVWFALGRAIPTLSLVTGAVGIALIDVYLGSGDGLTWTDNRLLSTGAGSVLLVVSTFILAVTPHVPRESHEATGLQKPPSRTVSDSLMRRARRALNRSPDWIVRWLRWPSQFFAISSGLLAVAILIGGFGWFASWRHESQWAFALAIASVLLATIYGFALTQTQWMINRLHSNPSKALSAQRRNHA